MDPDASRPPLKCITAIIHDAGREQALLEALVNKYGPEPKAEGKTEGQESDGGKKKAKSGAKDWKQRLTVFFDKYQPGKVATIDRVLQKYAGQACWDHSDACSESG
eukprot:gene21798-8452_t